MLPLQLLTLCLIALTLGLSTAHALEYPGKRRLSESEYRTVQAIYYPGFTIGGLIGELGGMVGLASLLALETPSAMTWLIVSSLGMMIVGHAVYWTLTHPTNAAWLKGTNLDASSTVFFGLWVTKETDWRRLRDMWELSHVARAALHLSSFLCLAIALKPLCGAAETMAGCSTGSCL
jgi:hypothetical protein